MREQNYRNWAGVVSLGARINLIGLKVKYYGAVLFYPGYLH